MPIEANLLLTLGLVLLLGLATDYLGRATALPRVTLLLLFGIVLGHDATQVLPTYTADWFPLITDMALLLVGFLLGGRLSRRELASNGRAVLWLSASVVLVTVLVVATGLWLIGTPLVVALLLAGIATATDPAATLEVVRETRATGRFTDTLMGIVAIDDAWGLIVFSIILAGAQFLMGAGGGVPLLFETLYELFGSILLGVAIGVPMAYLTGRLKPGEPTLVEALGIVFLCGGLAEYFDVSFLLSAMVLGATVANLARHHERPFHEIEDIEWPFMILFFVLTGASLEFESVPGVFGIAIAYMVLRVLGRWIGAWPGGWLAASEPVTRRWMGLALLPQAGVASGMALLAGNAFPEWRNTLLSITILATVVFEMVGPILTRIALRRAGAIPPS